MVFDVMMTVLESFHHNILIWIAEMTLRRGDRGEWEWALVDMALEVTGIWPIRECMGRQQAKIA